MKRLSALLASLLLTASFATQAVPITYDLTFIGSGPSTGSFIYDEDVTRFQDFTIRFDSFPGGPEDFDVLTFGFDEFLFEVLTGIPSGAGCTEEGAACRAAVALIGLDLEASFSRSSQNSAAQYELLDADGTGFFGNVFAQRRTTAVAEPGALSLLGLGLSMLTLTFIARRRRRTFAADAHHSESSH